VGSFGLAALFGVLLATGAAAQQGRQPLLYDGERPHPNDLTRAVVSDFDLFGEADLAWIGTRGRGTMFMHMQSDGPIDYYFVGGGSIINQIGTEVGTNQAFFMGGLFAGAPPSEWTKHMASVPSLANVTGGGYVANWNLNAWFLRFPNMWAAADGSLGFSHSGIAATDDGACTDFTADNVNSGSPLMPSNDCPETWGSDQFNSASRLIPFTEWVRYFNDAGANNFNWKWWQVPPEYVSEDLIGDWQTYGVTVDWASDNLARFGSVIPGGSGAPEPSGYPLGLTLRYDAYTFQNPDVANTVYYRAILINDSEQVYGTPLDYDSIYFGNQLGWLFGQDNQVHYRPDLGGVYTTSNGVNAGCNGAIVVSGVSGCGTRGFNGGGATVLVLNSPLGDMRNKLFSDPNSQFYAPGHPLSDDTITFNQGRICGFGGCWANTTNRSARSGYGLHAADVTAVLDGRSEADFNALGSTTWWRTFKNYDYPVRTAQWNRWMPGGWDWNNDGIQDTLTLDNCLGPLFGGIGTGGCTELWSDTMPGRLNNRYANFGGFMGAGPFPLAAGDTTSWTLAISTGPTQATTEANARNALNFYLNSYLGPESAPAPNIVSIATTPGDRGRNPGATAQLFWDDAPEQWTDVFLALAAAAVEAGEPALVAANPWLPDSMRTVATNNVNSILVFKSCDGGTSWTDDTNCNGDPAIDDLGAPVGTGWIPYATFFPDEQGRFPNAFLDVATTPGKTYLYSIVTKTNGFIVSLVIPPENIGDPITSEVVTYAPVLYSVLSSSTSDANVAAVYIPASRQTGGEEATSDFTIDDPLRPVDIYPVDVLITSDIEDGANYGIVFGDSAVVRAITDAATATSDTTWVSLYRTVPASTDGGTTITRTVYDELQLVTTNPNGVNFTGGVTTQVGDTLTTVYSDELVLLTLDASPSQAQEAAPLFTSSVLDGANTTPGTFFGRTDFPRWILNVNNNNAGDWNSTLWWAVISADSIEQQRAGGTNAQPTMTWLQSPSVATGESYNQYRWVFADMEYGPGLNGTGVFTLNLRDPEATNDEFNASIEARQTATTTSTSQEVADALGVAVEDLIAVDLPFEVTHQFPDRSVTTAMLADDKLTSLVLGMDVDQVTVDVPTDKWIPGDQVIFLETVNQFQTATGTAGEYVVLDGSGNPVVTDTFVTTWEPAMLGCIDPRPTCNPVTAGTRGSNPVSYLPVTPGTGTGSQFLEVQYLESFTPQTAYGFTITPTVTGADVTEITGEDLDEIKVVPNPYVVFSAYEQANAFRRLMFTGLPSEGTISIYTVAGQFVQRVTYDESDLSGNGDLYWNMRTKENTDLASGLYLFYVDGVAGDGLAVKKLGKFVVIR
jgi:hypothetical protein